MANIPRTLPISSTKKRKLSHLSQEDDPEHPIPLLPSAKAVSVIRQLRRLDILLEQELELLQKIRYKQKNQHKAATWWRHLGGTQRVAKRFHEEFGKYVLPRLPEIQTLANAQPASAVSAKPALRAEDLQIVVESSLRLLLLAEHASPINTKTMAALEQLLKAALFMPLAITLKALVARLESSIVLMAEELDSLLVLIASSVPATVKDSLTHGLRSQPKDLTKFWTRANAAHSITSTPVPSITQSEQTSRLGTPLLRSEPLASSSEPTTDQSTMPRKGKSKPRTVDTAERALVPDPKPSDSLGAGDANFSNEAPADMQMVIRDIEDLSQRKGKKAKKDVGTKTSWEGSEVPHLPLTFKEDEPKAPAVQAGNGTALPAAIKSPETTRALEQPKKLKVMKKKKAKKTAGDGDDIDAIFAGM